MNTGRSPRLRLIYSCAITTLYRMCLFSTHSFVDLLYRCCPATMCNTSNPSNPSNPSNATSTWSSDHQCLQGYRGILCGACDNDYVRLGDTCVSCIGGASIVGAVTSMLLSCFVIFLFSFVVLKKVKVLKKHGLKSKMVEISAQIKIFASWLQILSVLATTFDAVPWGSSFTSFSQNSGAVVNLDVSFITSSAACSLSLPFLHKFGLSALFPLGTSLVIKLAQFLILKMSVPVKVEDAKNKKMAVEAKADKLVLLFLVSWVRCTVQISTKDL